MTVEPLRCPAATPEVAGPHPTREVEQNRVPSSYRLGEPLTIECGYAAPYGVLEIYVVPVAAVVTLIVRLSPRRYACRPIVLSTFVGAAIVLIAVLVVGNGATWS